MSPSRITWLHRDDPPQAFPPVSAALREPNGLLAAGGDLSPRRLLYAYRSGIFPWYEEGQPILWWAPDPRCILRPARFHIARRLRRTLSSSTFEVSFNRAFEKVIDACASRRRGQRGTWITPDMRRAFTALHQAGWAHSVEVWRGEVLAGGLYGLASGLAFFGESMFTRESNGSKVAMLSLCRVLEDRDFAFVDCQVRSPHLLTLGAELVPREAFMRELADACRQPEPAKFWPQGRVEVAEYIESKGCSALQ